MSSSLIQCNNKPFLNRIVPCNKKWVLHNSQQWSTKWPDRDETPKHFSQPNLPPKKGHGQWWSAASLIHYSFLNPSKTITSEKYAQQINEMHQKLQRLQQALVNRKGPILHDITLCFTSQQIGLWSFASSAIFTWALANRLLLFQASRQLFLGKCFHNQQEAENAFQECVESWSIYFYTTGINKLTSHLQQCIDCNGSYFYE